MSRLARRLVLLALLAAVPAWAQQQPALPGGSPDQPIEIDADSLEVQQANQVAIFRGNVDAVQGSIRLQADELRVYYRGDGGAGSGAAAGTAAMDGNIVRIDAIGRVQVASPTETAQADLGIYDVPQRTITMQGNVVLTRGGNVLRGRELVMDMATGRSRIGGGRVKAIIQPRQEQ